MHVGSKRTFCPELRVDSWEVKQSEDVQTGEKVLIDEFAGAKRMDSSEHEKYLGDVISNDGSNTKNVQDRRAKGMGNVDQIMDILNGTVFGPFYFEVGLLLRKTLLVNSIMANS